MLSRSMGGQKIKLDYREVELLLSECLEGMRVLGKVGRVVGGE